MCFLAVLLAVTALSYSGYEPVRCTVTGTDVAEHLIEGDRFVTIHTQECGDLRKRWGVNSGNEHEIAAQFKTGTQYDFDMAWFPREVLMKLPGWPSDTWVRDHREVEG